MRGGGDIWSPRLVRWADVRKAVRAPAPPQPIAGARRAAGSWGCKELARASWAGSLAPRAIKCWRFKIQYISLIL